MSKHFSYPLSGADRFQLYFDEIARRNTGIGNVIRAVVTLDGIIAENEILESVKENEWFRLISELKLKKNYFSLRYRFENSGRQSQLNLSFHNSTLQGAMNIALSRDCDLRNGNKIYLDIFFANDKTHLIFSVNHVLMDHAGMENLLLSFTGKINLASFNTRKNKKSFTKNLSGAFASTRHVANLSNWSMKHLPSGNKSSSSFGLTELSAEETSRIKKRMISELKTNSLSFFLGSSLIALGKMKNLLKGNDYFIPVPVDRRTAFNQNTLLSNFISFLYFKTKDADLDSLEKVTSVISGQMISQAKKNLPEKFTSLLEVFRFVPKIFYNSFIGLPSRGRAATFAFSLLPDSKMEEKKMFGKKILDVTHYAPVISPPGLNVIFSEFNGRLKFLCSFDEGMISKSDVMSYMGTLKQILLG